MAARLLYWLAIGALGLAPFDFAQGTQSSSGLGGIWSLNRGASEFPKELGFSIDTSAAVEPGQQPAQPAGGGRSRRGGGGGGSRSSGTPFLERRESSEDAKRLRLVTDEARVPPSRLIIVDNQTAVTITNELGQSRTFHTTGRDESVEIEGTPVPVTSVRDGERVVVIYHVEQDRDVRYTYTTGGDPRRLTVETEFLDHGNGDKVTRVYDSGTGAVAAAPGLPASPGSPALPGRSGEALDQRPGAEFKGLKDLGILVEDLGPEATACGLKRESIEEALTKKLSAAGMHVRRNSDEDTYLYVNIITSSTPSGSCTSRYDAFLYTYASAKLSYRDQPVLVQVSLMHRGGIGTTGMTSHSAAVTRGLEGYIDVFLSQIQSANR